VGAVRPARIDHRQIVDAAIALAQDEGAASVSMARVAEQLGVAVPARYDDATPILHRVLDRWADLPDDRGGYDDVLFEWQVDLELAGWRAVLAGQLPTRLLGPPQR
jgi:hypothetical protein